MCLIQSRISDCHSVCGDRTRYGRLEFPEPIGHIFFQNRHFPQSTGSKVHHAKIGILGEQDRIYDEAEKCTVRMLPGKAKVVKELRGKSENVMINSPFYCEYGSYIEEGEIFLPTIIVRS